MGLSERITGVRDEHYGLISILYHALHGAETVEEYALDAEAAGDERLAKFFREAQTTQRQLAEQAKGLLGIAVTPEVEAAPPETAVPLDTVPDDVAPRPAGMQPEQETSPITAAPNEDLAPPEEAFPPDTPSPPDGEQPPRSGPYLPGSPSAS